MTQDELHVRLLAIAESVLDHHIRPSLAGQQAADLVRDFRAGLTGSESGCNRSGLIRLAHPETFHQPTGKRSRGKRAEQTWTASYPYKSYAFDGATRAEALGKLVEYCQGYFGIEIEG